MPFIPISFVVAILLLVLFFAVLKSDDGPVFSGPRNLPFLALILLGAFQAFLSGLRWGYGIEAAGYIAPIGAALLPPLAYAGVARLSMERQDQTLLRENELRPGGPRRFLHVEMFTQPPLTATLSATATPTTR